MNSNVVNLMDALRRSVEAEKPARAAASKAAETEEAGAARGQSAEGGLRLAIAREPWKPE